mgnify:CR=1 FL=1
MRNFILITILLTLGSYLEAQVIATGDTILCEGQEGQVGVTLSANAVAIDLTDSGIYTDDLHGGVIDMEFEFTFYGNNYTDVVLSSNNFLTFNTAAANTYSDWTIDAAVPSAMDPPMNAILCPWQDIQPGVNGNGIIAYATIGEEPNRVFIASFCGIPMYSCTEICYSSQIKLFESTNIIETHIAQKVLCSSWNSGYAIHALHNENGTIAHVVTGSDGVVRNYPNEWTCENDAWRFTPNGDNDYTLEEIEFAPAVAGTDIIWQDEFGNEIGTGNEFVVFPGGNVTYTAGASMCGEAGDWCGFEGGIEGTDVNIVFEELSISGSSADISCYNENNGNIEVIAPNQGDWNYTLYQQDIEVSSITEENSDNYLFDNLAPGLYSVTIGTPDCTSDVLEFIIAEPELLELTSDTEDVSCNGGNDGIVEYTIIGGTPPYENLSDQFNLSAGNYTTTINDANGCTASTPFTISEPAAALSTETSIGGVTCADAQNGFIEISVSGGTSPYNYTWSNSDGFYSNESNIDDLDGGTYNLSITDANNCSYDTTVTVLENEGMSIDPLWSECISDNGEITITTNGGTPPYAYTLLNVNTDETQINNNGFFNNLIEGDYLIEISDIFGCLEEVFINLNARPIADFSADEYTFYLSNTPTQFNSINNDIDITDWIWDFGDNNTSNLENPTHLYLEPGSYYVTLTVIDEMGCENAITKEIIVLQDYYSYTPDIFTPNDDGINDVFSPSLKNIDMNSYNLLIFDRWGNLIFETSNYNEGWDGKLKNGTLLKSDVYSYKINYNTNLGIEKEETGRLIMAR